MHYGWQRGAAVRSAATRRRDFVCCRGAATAGCEAAPVARARSPPARLRLPRPPTPAVASTQDCESIYQLPARLSDHSTIRSSDHEEEPVDIVRVTGLVKRYGDLLALDHFDLSIKQGEIFGLLGPNGSGKTTAINCMLQLLTYDRGSIELFGEAMAPTRYDLKRRIGMVPQQVAVLEELTVRENIDFFCSLYVRDRARRRALVDEAIEFVDLGDYVRFRPKKLSGGLLRRLNIACGIAHKPELIFFDEPTVAVDPQSRNAILSGIQGLRDEGATVVYTSHYMEEVEQVCSQIMIMDRGRVLAQGTNEELKRMVSTGEKIVVELSELPARVLERLRALPHVLDAAFADGELTVRCEASPHNLVDVLGVLGAARIVPGRVWAEPPTLNDVFLELTGRELRD